MYSTRGGDLEGRDSQDRVDEVSVGVEGDKGKDEEYFGGSKKTASGLRYHSGPSLVPEISGEAGTEGSCKALKGHSHFT